MISTAPRARLACGWCPTVTCWEGKTDAQGPRGPDPRDAERRSKGGAPRRGYSSRLTWAGHPPTHTHTHLGLGSPSWSIKGWAGDQHREHLCSVINGQTASAVGEGLSTLWASRGSLLGSPLPPSGKTKDVSLAPTSSGQTQLAAVSSFWPLRSPTLPSAQTPQGPQKCL